MLNSTCGVEVAKHYVLYELNYNCSTLNGAEVPATTILYSIFSVLCMFLAFITYLYYNSVTVLNYTIHINAISNNWWILYFLLTGVRCIIQSLHYSHKYKNQGYYLANWILGSFEVLMLCFALNYQRKFRTSAFICKEIDIVSKHGLKRSLASDCKGLCRVFTSSGAVFTCQYLFIITSILLLVFLSRPIDWFWLYISFLLLLHVSALIMCTLIAIKGGTDEPAIKTKVYFFLSVLLVIPEHLPLFFWNHCAGIVCWGDVMTLFDLFIIFKMISLVFIFRALHLEYNRLKHYSVLVLLTLPYFSSQLVNRGEVKIEFVQDLYTINEDMVSSDIVVAIDFATRKDDM